MSAWARAVGEGKGVCYRRIRRGGWVGGGGGHWCHLGKNIVAGTTDKYIIAHVILGGGDLCSPCLCFDI